VHALGCSWQQSYHVCCGSSYWQAGWLPCTYGAVLHSCGIALSCAAVVQLTAVLHAVAGLSWQKPPIRTNPFFVPSSAKRAYSVKPYCALYVLLTLLRTCRALVSSINDGNPSRPIHPDFASSTDTGAGIIQDGIPFMTVDSNPAKAQQFPPGPTIFNMYPSESDVTAGELVDGLKSRCCCVICKCMKVGA
jgi:hypothetical protein